MIGTPAVLSAKAITVLPVPASVGPVNEVAPTLLNDKSDLYFTLATAGVT
jgi:hypothetical protein